MKQTVLILLAVCLLAFTASAMPLKTSPTGTFTWIEGGAGVECNAAHAFEAGSNYLPVASLKIVGYQNAVNNARFGYIKTSLIVTTNVTRIMKKNPHAGIAVNVGPELCLGVTTDFKGYSYLYLDGAGAMTLLTEFLGGVIGVSP